MDKNQELRLLLKCSVLEHELRINKTNYYFNCKLEALEALNKLKELRKKSPSKSLNRQITELKYSCESFKDKLERAEKYNSEMLNEFLKHDGNNDLYQSIIENSTDLYDSLTIMFLKALSTIEKGKSKNISCALLEESENGTIFINGKKFIIHT